MSVGVAQQTISLILPNFAKNMIGIKLAVNALFIDNQDLILILCSRYTTIMQKQAYGNQNKLLGSKHVKSIPKKSYAHLQSIWNAPISSTIQIIEGSMSHGKAQQKHVDVLLPLHSHLNDRQIHLIPYHSSYCFILFFYIKTKTYNFSYYYQYFLYCFSNYQLYNPANGQILYIGQTHQSVISIYYKQIKSFYPFKIIIVKIGSKCTLAIMNNQNEFFLILRGASSQDGESSSSRENGLNDLLRPSQSLFPKNGFSKNLPIIMAEVAQKTSKKLLSFLLVSRLSSSGRLMWVKLKISIPSSFFEVLEAISNKTEDSTQTLSFSSLAIYSSRTCWEAWMSSIAMSLGQQSATKFKNSLSFSCYLRFKINLFLAASERLLPAIVINSSQVIPEEMSQSPSGKRLRTVGSYFYRSVLANSMQFQSSFVKTSLCSDMQLSSKLISQAWEMFRVDF